MRNILLLLLLIVSAAAHRLRPQLRPPKGFGRVSRKWRAIAREAAAVRTAKAAKVRKKKDWAEGLGVFMATLGENKDWMTAWADDGSWDNYPLVIDDRVVAGGTEGVCPTACRLLSGLSGIKVAGLSRVRAGGRIEPHTDGGCGLSFGSLSLHLCLSGTSKLRVGDRVYVQEPGRVIVFNPEVEHEVINDGGVDRTLLFVNFRRTA